jgi:hypothetical protein
MAAYCDHGFKHLGSTRYREFLVFNIWVPRDTGSFLCLTFGFLEKQGVCCIVHLESIRYTELLVLNI